VFAKCAFIFFTFYKVLRSITWLKKSFTAQALGLDELPYAKFGN
jgi:hypothetical protein